MNTKRLTRSTSDKMLGGVCAGLAHYFDIDPTLVRLAFVGLFFLGAGSPFLIYLVLWLIMPEEGTISTAAQETLSNNIKDMSDRARDLGRKVQTQFTPQQRTAAPKTPSDDSPSI